MTTSRYALCAAFLLLVTVGSLGQAAPEVRPLFDQALDLALTRDTAPVNTGDTRMTFRVVPPSGHESQVIFLLHGKTTTALAMQAVSVRKEFADWLAAGQSPELTEWAKTVNVQKTNFEVPPEMRSLLDSYLTTDFSHCVKMDTGRRRPIHYELWVETDREVHDIHGYSSGAGQCAGLQWMRQLRQAVRAQVPQLATSSQ
jgi:hypothetical protein